MSDARLHVHIQSNPKTSPVFQMTPRLYQAARKRNADVASRVKGTIATDRPGFYRHMKSADVLVGWGFPRDHLSEVAPRLKWIHIIGAGIEHLLPLDWLPANVTLTTNSGVHASKISEYITMALLALNMGLPSLVTSQQKREWNELYTPSIRGKTLLVVGVGHMGGAGAQRAKSLGMKVLGVRRSGKPRRYVDSMVRPAQLHRVLPRADFVLITTPVTSETRQLIGKAELDLMKPGASFINLGRADVVDYVTLRKKLINRQIAGAILDVFAPEPLPESSPLWKTPHLLITPHVASDDRDAYIPLTFDLMFENIRRYLAGRALLNRVVPDREY